MFCAKMQALKVKEFLKDLLNHVSGIEIRGKDISGKPEKNSYKITKIGLPIDFRGDLWYTETEIQMLCRFFGEECFL